MKKRDLINERLQKAWDEYSAAGDSAMLMRLRTAFEGHGLGHGPVLVRKLTERQAERLNGADSLESPMILLGGEGHSWALVENNESLGELIDTISSEDYAAGGKELTLSEIMTDVTFRQEEWVEKQVAKSIKSLTRKLRSAHTAAARKAK